MRFFTRELHERVNSGDMKAGLDEFERRWVAYNAQLAELRDRLSAISFSFFSNVNSHDATLLSVAFGDDITEKHGRRRTDVVNKRRMRARVRLLLEDGRTAEIVYRRVRKAAFEYSMDDPWHRSRNAVDDLLNDELTDAGDGFMGHEFLFSSGATLRIEFRDVSCRLKGRRLSR